MIPSKPDAFIVSSEVTISPELSDQLEGAFRDRLHLVEAAPGFQRLEVWQDINVPGVFQMVSWWDDAERFAEYMKSDDHRRSHARIPSAPERPRGTAFRRYRLVPDPGVSNGE
ncbi:MAG: antibiotic biosynthesis monooxygenase family protein [Actinomycetota bacterium]|nr:antibiotic biosynthesis monooxygenase family protein [Actinomycetota bacterium]